MAKEGGVRGEGREGEEEGREGGWGKEGQGRGGTGGKRSPPPHMEWHFCLGTEVPRLSAGGVGPTVRGTSEVQSAQEWKCKVHNSILQNGGLD